MNCASCRVARKKDLIALERALVAIFADGDRGRDPVDRRNNRCCSSR